MLILGKEKEGERRISIAIFGSSDEATAVLYADLCDEVAQAFLNLARKVPLQLLTGMSAGVAERVFRRVQESREDGLQINLIGFSPWPDKEAHRLSGDPLNHVDNEDEVPYLTGEYNDPKARFIDNASRLAQSAQLAVVLPGGRGTMIEQAMIDYLGKPTIEVENSDSLTLLQATVLRMLGNGEGIEVAIEDDAELSHVAII